MNIGNESPYGGMTVNERLVEAGLFDQFEAAAYAYDTDLLKQIMAKVDLSPDNIQAILIWIRDSPQSRYRKVNQ